MRWSCLVLLAQVALVGADAPAPMAYHGSAAADAIHALTMIAAGDADAVAALPAAIWHAEVAIPDHDDADLARRWTRCLPGALERCPSERRGAVLAWIDRACQVDLAQHPAEPWRAGDYLPAPSALAAMRLLSARAFDHGRLLESLSACALLADEAGGSQTSARLQAALVLCGLGPTVDPALALEPPGEPQPMPSLHLPPRSAGAEGLSVHWVRTPGYLLAVSLGGTSWQYRVSVDAEIVAGPGGVVIRDADGLRWLDELGHATTLASPPGSTRLLAIGGGQAWFATGDRAWRLPLSGGAPRELHLGAIPVLPPLVRGTRSLWLLPDELRLFDGDHELARMRHRLAVNPSWRLEAAAGGMAALIAPDGGSWRIAPLQEALAQAPVLEQARLLIAAHRNADALQLLAGSPDAASASGRKLQIAAHCALGPAHVAGMADQLAALAGDPADAMGVRFVAWRLAPADAAASRRLLLLDTLRAAGQAQVSWSIADIQAEEAQWSHQSTAAIMADALEASAAAKQRISAEEPLRGVALTATPPPPVSDEVVDDPQLGRVHRYGEHLLTLTSAGGATEVADHALGGHALRWRVRWPSDPRQPSRSLAIVDDAVLVGEGTADLFVVDLDTGSLRGHVDCGDAPADPTRACIAGAVLALPGSSDEELLLASGLSESSFDPPAELVGHLVRLPRPARWLAPIPPLDAVIAVLAEGQALAYPGARPVQLPEPLLRAPRPPVLNGELLYLTGADGVISLFTWNPAH